MSGVKDARNNDCDDECTENTCYWVTERGCNYLNEDSHKFIDASCEASDADMIEAIDSRGDGTTKECSNRGLL